ncbi:hypothetical protein HDE68_001176 [Pedobacter cryoconitis]|uniref:Uncharacterized protein n=1 Tax=Pedobacter cryoconitis TaxID=188932 RepID=A0A7W8ZJQ7_9SPHI|nr:hypothetical protein [Pedobacter cryoconitis]MBB5635291.1 hypothetical protein [Pedobacter cryoconitis]
MKTALLFIYTFLSLNLTMALPSHQKATGESVYICISRGAKKYHSHKCHGLLRCTHEIKAVTRAEALKRKYTACKICY